MNTFGISHSGEGDRDVFNEKPSKEEQLSATQVSEKSFFMQCSALSGCAMFEVLCLVLHNRLSALIALKSA